MDKQTRRDALKATAAAAIAASLPARAQPKRRFFSEREFALVDELTELIVPADGHSPGARAAEVAAYLDQSLGELRDPKAKRMWKDGLRRIESLSREMHGRPFLEAAREQRVAVVSRIAANETNERMPEEFFFSELKRRTVRAYYSSKIGIHAEMEYKGNTVLAEFAGYDPE